MAQRGKQAVGVKVTCSVVGQAVQSDLMRYFGNCNIAFDLGSIACSPSPFNRDFAVVNGDQPVGTSKETLGREHGTHFDLRWPSSASPSSHEVEVTLTFTSPSPWIEIFVSSCWNHAFAHGVTFLFFQCQLAVVLSIDILRTDVEGG